MKRRDFVTMLGAGSFFGTTRRASAQGGMREAWDAWKAAFLGPEGRVIDALQGEASHSEGQGWGLLLAVAFDDPVTARRIVGWTEIHLAVRRDPLLAWRWRPDEGVEDYNNASDGDLFYAWALLRAARRFGEAAYAGRAAELARAIAAILVTNHPAGDGRLLLLPAAERFSGGDAVTVNPSYYMPLAMHDLAAAFDLPALARVAEDGATLLGEIAEAGLVPDWVTVTGETWRSAAPLSTAYGYDALRVPLYLVWSGRDAHPAVVRARALLSRSGEGIPVVAAPDGEVRERSDAPGYAAVASLIDCTGRAMPAKPMPAFTPVQPYYPATLHLLAGLAAQETALACL